MGEIPSGFFVPGLVIDAWRERSTAPRDSVRMGKHRVVDTVFKAGKDAHDRGVLRALGPYRKRSSSYDDWILGWDAALKASSGDRSKLAEKADVIPVHDVEVQKDLSEDSAVLGDIPTEK